MNALEDRSKIDLLDRQAEQARTSAQYATAEALFAEAARLADAGSDWSTRIRLHSKLAGCRRMLSKNEAALATYVWLMTLARNPEIGSALTASGEVAYLCMAYANFVEVGRYLPAMPVSQLHQVLDEAEQFLAEIGHPEWAHALYLQRGLLQEQEGRMAEARASMESSLSLRRRHMDIFGFSVWAHLFSLADVLVKLKEYEEAARIYLEIWESPDANPHGRRSAATGLAQVARARGAWDEAEQWAREAVAVAAPLQNPHAKFLAHHELVWLLLNREKIAQAAHEGALLWYHTRREGSEGATYSNAAMLCRVRLACARQAVGLSPNLEEALPEPAVPPPPSLGQQVMGYLQAAERWVRQARGQSTSPYQKVPAPDSSLPPHLRARAMRYLRAAECWLARAQEPARRLDEQSRREVKGTELHYLAERMAALRAWLER